MAKWKVVPIENEQDYSKLDGLASIEVLDEYSIVKENENKLKKKNAVSNVKKKKKKASALKSVAGVNKNQGFEVTEVAVDDNSFLKEMSEWKRHGIRDDILRALYEKGYLSPTQIQEVCIHGAVSSKKSDIVGASETGSGKTFAFGIPVVQQILYWKDKMKSESADVFAKKAKLRALILTPTRELACQIKDHLTILCKYTDIKIALVVGGLAREKQERLLKRRPEIVVGTPGRIWELFELGNEHLKDIPRVRILVIDEADRMLERQHFAELGQILEKMNSEPKNQEKRRNFVFSATLTVVHDPPSYHHGKRKRPKSKLQDLLKKIGIKRQLVYDLSANDLTPVGLKEYKIECGFEEKDYFLYHFLSKLTGSCIIFCNSIGCVRRLANLLTILRSQPLALHANMEQKQRLKNLDKFRMGSGKILVATEVAARGLDIIGVENVVHYQVPRTAESYVHRSGRTARASHSGTTLVLVSPEEEKTFRSLMRTLKKENLDSWEVSLDEVNWAKKIVHVARDMDQLSMAVKKTKNNEMWYERAAREMDLLLDEDEMPKKTSDVAMKKAKKELSFKQKELERLLKTPHVPRGFSGKYPDLNRSLDNFESNVKKKRKSS